MGAGDQGMMFRVRRCRHPELMPLPIMLAQHLVARRPRSACRGDPRSAPGRQEPGDGRLRRRSSRGDLLGGALHPTRSALGRRTERPRRAVTEQIVRPVLGEWWERRHRDPSTPPAASPGADRPETPGSPDARSSWTPTGLGSPRRGCLQRRGPLEGGPVGGIRGPLHHENVVAAGLAHECEVRLGYAIGVADPTMLSVDCKGTASAGITEKAIEEAVREVFGRLTPASIISVLDLRRPIYRPTAYHGHFGRIADQPAGFFTWERVDRAPLLAAAVGAAVGA